MKTTSPTPDAILQTAFGFWNSKVLLTAVTFDLFGTLGQRRLTGPEIGKKLDLHPRGVADFFDAELLGRATNTRDRHSHRARRPTSWCFANDREARTQIRGRRYDARVVGGISSDTSDGKFIVW